MASAGLILTGGSSRRMGTDKGLLTLGGQTFALRTGRLLSEATAPALEVGSGISGLSGVSELWPGEGPLAALASGVVALAESGWNGSVVVVATDLPRLTGSLLEWLVSHPSPRSVVPLLEDRPQPLCARYCGADLALAVKIVEAGGRAMQLLLDSADAHLADPDEWVPAAGRLDTLADVDTPGDLARLREEG